MPPAYLRAPIIGVFTAAVAVFVPGCTGKVPQTRRQAAATRGRRGAFGSPGGVYRCRSCGWWHTSHMLAPAGKASLERDKG